MPVWYAKIDLAPEVEAYKLGALSIPELAAKVVEIIKASDWRKFTPYPDTFDDHLGRLLQAETPSQYEAAFEYVYDLADEDRVWIATH
jgi:hypothetical protein